MKPLPKIHQLLAITLLAAATPLAAQEADPCIADGTCRVIAPLRVESPEGLENTIAMGMTLPWVTQGNVLLTPGDAVVVRLDEVEGVLIPVLARIGDGARSGELAASEVRFDFGGFERGNLRLTVLSAFADPVEYAALKVTLNAGPERTSVCTLMPGVSVFESWEEPIYQMALWGFRRTEDMACSEIDLGTPDELQRRAD